MSAAPVMRAVEEPMPVPLRPGERRRMYLVERAFRDWWGRIDACLDRLSRTCADVWQFFWSRETAELFERVAVILLTILTVTVACSVVVHDLEGTGVGLGIAAIMCVAVSTTFVLFAWIAMVCWRGPGLFAALVVSSVGSVGTVGLLGLVTLGVALVAFGAYLLVLLVLMLLMVLVFVPMRLYDEAVLLWRRIARRCPYDDCGRGGLPIHVCPCGARYGDLQPSLYGILYHRCRHVDRTVKLPTLDVLGRSKLPRLCRHCERPIMLSSFGTLPERPIAIVGGTGAGKTVFLRQATRCLRDYLGAVPGARVEVDSAEHREDLERDLRLLDEGRVLAKTAGDVMQAFALAVRLHGPRPLRCLLYLFDAPGEHFTTMDRFGRKQVVQHLAGVVLLVDPFSLPGLADQADMGASPFAKVVHTFLAASTAMHCGRDGRCEVPLAVVLGKSDALPVADRGPLAREEVDRGPYVEAMLTRLGAGNELRALRQRFADLAFFACSSLGRSPSLLPHEPFRPERVLDPVLWLLERIEGVRLLPAPAPGYQR